MTGAPAQAPAAGPRRCPACAGGEFALDPGAGREGVFSIVRCAGCGLRLTEPRARAADLPGFYPAEYYGEGGPRFRPLAERIAVWLRDRRAAWVARLRPPGAVLDVGCGHGYMLAALRARGWHVQGVELHEAAARYGREQLGLPITVGEVESLGLPPASFDVVVFWQSFEHVPDPRATIAETARLLRPGGLAVISVPNAASWQARWAGPHWFHWELPRHLYHWDPATLTRLCAAAGLTVERTSHVNWEQNPFGWTQSILNRLGFPPNQLFNGMRATFPGGRSPLVQRLLAGPLLGAGFLLAGAESLARRGGTFTVVARRAAA
jgi:SAM-dependent methyltransferase